MAVIRPFRGVRYNPAVVGNLASVVAPPYDIVTPEARISYEARSPHNVIYLELGSARTDDSAIANRYTRAATSYRDWLHTGALQVDSTTSFYLYEERLDDHGETRTRRSLLAPVRLANWEEKIILPHEFTFPGPKIDRLNLLAATRAQFSPLLAMYDDPGRIGRLLSDVARSPATAELTVSEGSVAAAAKTHRLWQVTNREIVAEIVATFRPLQIYIADGHHRYETAIVYRDQQRRAGGDQDAPSEYTLMALVGTDDPGMLVRPTHRMLRGLGQLDSRVVLPRLSERFEIERIAGSDVPSEGVPSDTPASPTYTILGLEPGWSHRIVLRTEVDLERELPGVPEVLRSLDTTILQRLIFEGVLGLDPGDSENGERIQYTRDPEEASRAFASGQAQLVVFLNPTPMWQIRATAQAGERMPQKSTYFYPKPLTGLVFYDHERAFSL